MHFCSPLRSEPALFLQKDKWKYAYVSLGNVHRKIFVHRDLVALHFQWLLGATNGNQKQTVAKRDIASEPISEVASEHILPEVCPNLARSLPKFAQT